jgi:ATP-dependent Clp protease protease subunit
MLTGYDDGLPGAPRPEPPPAGRSAVAVLTLVGVVLLGALGLVNFALSAASYRNARRAQREIEAITMAHTDVSEVLARTEAAAKRRAEDVADRIAELEALQEKSSSELVSRLDAAQSRSATELLAKLEAARARSTAELVAKLEGLRSGMAAVDFEPLAEIAEEVIDQLSDAGGLTTTLNPDDPVLQARILVVAEDINAVLARKLIRGLLYLDRLEPGKPIDLYLRTEGGWSDDAHAICDVMQRMKSPVNTWAIGGCYSSGTAILAAGTGKRRALPMARMMVHVNENGDDDRYSMEKLLREQDEAFWKRHAKLPAAFFPMVEEKEYYLSAKQALEYGIIDEIWKRE